MLAVSQSRSLAVSHSRSLLSQVKSSYAQPILLVSCHLQLLCLPMDVLRSRRFQICGSSVEMALDGVCVVDKGGWKR